MISSQQKTPVLIEDKNQHEGNEGKKSDFVKRSVRNFYDHVSQPEKGSEEDEFQGGKSNEKREEGGD
jgi:hypothetical protein